MLYPLNPILSGIWTGYLLEIAVIGNLSTKVNTLSGKQITDHANIASLLSDVSDLTGVSGAFASQLYVDTAISNLDDSFNISLVNLQGDVDAISGFVQTLLGQSGSWASKSYVSGISGGLQSQITTNGSAISILNGLTGSFASTGYVSNSSGTLQSQISTNTTNLNTVSGKLGHSINIGVDGGGVAVTGAFLGYFFAPFNGVINNWRLVADRTGSCSINVWKSDGSRVPVSGDGIAGNQKPALTGQQFASSANVTGWSTAVSAGDMFGFNLDSTSGITKFTLTISYL